MVTETTAVTSPHTVISSLPNTIHSQRVGQEKGTKVEILARSSNNPQILEDGQVR